MIDLYTYATSNGRRASVALEECGLAYRVHQINIEKGEQRRRSFLKINPMGQIPAIVDHDGPGGKTLSLAQSGAIVLYAAEKSGRLLPKSALRRALAYQWFAQVMSDVAPASAALFYVTMWVPGKPKAARKYFHERLVDALRHCDRRLGEADYLAGEYSIADVALYPTVAVRSDIIARVKGLKNLKRWAKRVGARPAVRRGMKATG
jgi:GST-like protein